MVIRLFLVPARIVQCIHIYLHSGAEMYMRY